MSTILSVSNLRKTFKVGFFGAKHEVLKGIEFSVRSGTITGFLGANGAGKTTTMKSVLGLIFPDQGEFNYFGSRTLTSEVKKKIGFLPERPYFYSYLTGMEFLFFYGQISGSMKAASLRDRSLSLLDQVGLTYAKDKPLREYSKGMLQKIGFAQALIHEPELVILDEPMSGLDPDGRYYLSQLIRDSAKDGHSVFLSSHLLHDTEQLCDELVVLKEGKVFFEGKTKEILQQIDATFEIQFLQNDKQKTVEVPDLQAVQSKISELSQQGCLIEKIEQSRITLEEYFVKDVLRDK